MRAALTLLLWLLAGPALAQGVTVENRRGAQHFESVPERIVVLDWAMAEQVLDLGLVPVAAPDLASYRDWVGQPELPSGVVEIGRHEAPNLDLLAELSPDLILAKDIPAQDVARLEKIAPVLVFDAFDAGHDNVAAARCIYLTLARLFDREALARQRLREMEAEINALAADLRLALGNKIDRVAVIRLNDKANVWVFGENSFAEAAIERLGLTNALPQPRSRWGAAQRPLESLAKVETGAVLAIRPHMPGEAVFDTAIWRFMPFVRNGRFAETRPVWSYGGILSLGRHARAFHDALMTLAP